MITTDPLGGNYLYHEQTKTAATGMNVRPPGKRYCETCETYQPKGTERPFKGWKCRECRK